jgi:hypothetical protein
LQRLDPNKDKGAVVFYAALLAVFIFISCLPFSSALQKTAMAKFHLTVKPFGRWALLQFVPAMYNFQNEVYWSFTPLAELSDPALSGMSTHLSVNHYPLRMIYFRMNRQAVIYDRPVYIYLRSLYRGRQLITSYLLLTTPRQVRVQLLNTYERLER